MAFQPIKQINTIIQQQYFEPTISWAFRVVLALNVPLIALPLIFGFSYKIIWAAFGAYMLSLIDYRGPHYKKIIIQSVEASLIFVACLVGMFVGKSWLLSVASMFIVGMFAALIRNWSDYGSSIGVAVGFFFLFGMANPMTFAESLPYALYVFAGSVWAILITVLSFPFSPSNPVRRSVAKIWKANTDFLDLLIQTYTSGKPVDPIILTQKELDMRTAINQSINLFARRQTETTRLKAEHYDMMMELRKTSSLFSATLNAMHEELGALNAPGFLAIKQTVVYKTLSSMAQASARMALVVFTLRAEDFTMAKVRVKRLEIALELLQDEVATITLPEADKQVLDHFTETLYKAHAYLEQMISQIEMKQNYTKSDYLENYKLSLNNFLTGLKPNALLDFARDMFNINSQQFKYALRVAIGLCIGVFAFKFFNIDHGHWIPLTMIIVIQPYYGATRKKGIERIAGTVAGILVGGIIMLLPLPHYVFVALLVVISFFVAYFLRNNYKVGVFFVTIMMVVMMQISQQASWELIGWRIISTLIGAALALLASYAFWPIWESQRFPALMKVAVTQNKHYLSQVIKYLNRQLPANESWHKHRRLAEAANNDVFACVQRMYEEPQNRQKQTDISFGKVGANIRMAREITSIGLMLQSTAHKTPIAALTSYYEKASEIFDWIIAHISQSGRSSQLPDLNAIRECLNDPVFDEDEELRFIKTELQKVLFELETICLLIKKEKYTH